MSGNRLFSRQRHEIQLLVRNGAVRADHGAPAAVAASHRKPPVAVMLALAAINVMLFMADRPSDLGLRPVGDEGTATAAPAPAANSIVAAAFSALREKMDPRRVNGGVFLGLDGLVIKSHGSTDGLGYCGAVEIAYDVVRHDLMSRIRDLVSLSQDLRTAETRSAVAETEAPVASDDATL